MAKSLSASFHFFLFVTMSVVLQGLANGEVAALFIFGDSTADVGTNNFLVTQAKANFLYNGIDYPYSKPTGRFSNGFNTVDQIAKLFGFLSSPEPFFTLQSRAQSFKRDVLRGVNFASGGSGILNFTGKKWGEVVPLENQIKQFELVYGNITELLSPTASSSFLSSSMFIISTGSNDLMEFYNNDSKLSYTKQQYLDMLQVTLSSSLQRLYQLGARRFGVIGVGPVGCCPSQLANSNSLGCVQDLNALAGEFHANVAGLLQNMSSTNQGMKYSLGDTLQMTLLMMEDPLVFGFKNVESACCGQGSFNGASPCMKSINGTNLCRDRDQYLFWDWFHPTEHASELAALTLYGGGSKLVTPMNFSQLANQ